MRTDRITKRDLYLDNGVAKCWSIDLDARVVERWRPAQHTAELFRDSITWTSRNDVRLTIDLKTYFDWIAAKGRLLERWRITSGRVRELFTNVVDPVLGHGADSKAFLREASKHPLVEIALGRFGQKLKPSK